MKKEISTISDIAQLTGVSVATVSRILNNKGSVKEDTRIRVLETMQNANISPKLLYKNKPELGNLIVVVVCDGDNPVVGTFLSGIQQCASRKGYYVVQFNCQNRNSNVQDELDFFIGQLPVAGFIFLNLLGDTSVMENIASRYPTVIGYEQFKSESITCIGIDDYSASKNAVNYLLSTGRKRIAMLNSDHSMPFAARREKGYTDALISAGYEINNEYILHISDFDFNLARNAAAHLLTLNPRPDAFFAITDTFAAAIIKEATRIGLHVPKDIAVIGFDNTDVSSMTEPAITTVNQPSFQIGYQSCNQLLEKIINPDISSKLIWLDYEFIVRQST